MIELTIEDIPPSLNKLLRMHWSQRVKVLTRWKRLLWAARCQISGSPLVPLSKASLSIERRSKGQLDPDNLVASMKLVIDGLRDQKFILDDSPDHITLTVTQCRGKPRTLIRIEDISTSASCALKPLSARASSAANS